MLKLHAESQDLCVAQVVALLEVDFLIRAVTVGVTLPPLDVCEACSTPRARSGLGFAAGGMWRSEPRRLGFRKGGHTTLYLTLYLRCIQTWAGYIVSQCIHSAPPLYLPSRVGMLSGMANLGGQAWAPQPG